jgi:hypothetical protein
LRLEREQQSESVDDIQVDFSDINKLFEEKGQGPHLLELEFEPVTPAPVEYISNRTGKETVRWTFRHKLTKTEVNRYRTKSGKSFDTGVLSHCLQSLKVSKDRVAYERAKLILQLNGKKTSTTLKDDATNVNRTLNREDLVKQWVSTCLLFSFVVCPIY